MAKRSFYEQETTINFNRAESTADIYTMEPKLIHRLARLAEEFPDQFICKRVGTDGAVFYQVPKKCVFVRKPMSESYRATLSERAMQTFHLRRKTP